MSDDCKIYVGHLHSRTRERDIRDEFERYGRIVALKMKNRFCFIDYEDPRDADEAIRDMDGRDFDGEKIVVERPKGREARGKGFRPERSDWRIRVENIPSRIHWSELKDKFRNCGEVIFGDVHKDNGYLEFRYKEDMYRALDDMHRTDWHGDMIYVYRDYPSQHRSREKNYDSRDSRRRARSPSRSRSRSRTRSRSPARDRRDRRSNSKSRSISRSPVKKERSSPRRSKSPARAESRKRSNDRSRSTSPVKNEREKSPARSRSPVKNEDSPARDRSRS